MTTISATEEDYKEQLMEVLRQSGLSDEEIDEMIREIEDEQNL